MVAAQAGRDPVHLRLRLVARDARLQLADDVVVLAVADLCGVGIQLERHDDLGVERAAERRHHLAREVEALREHADHLIWLAVQDQRAADRGRIAAEAAHPGRVAEDGGAARAGGGVVRPEQPSECGAGAEHRQQVGGRPDRADPLRCALAREVVVRADRDRELLEAAVARLHVEVLRGREPVLRDADAGRAVPQDHQAIGVRIGQRPQQQRARDAEDRRVRADPDRERQHDGAAKPGLRASERSACARSRTKPFTRAAPPRSGACARASGSPSP